MPAGDATGTTSTPDLAALNALQQRLEWLYEVRLDYRVGDFVITDPVLANALEGNPGARPVAEKLLVHQHEDGLDLTLYLDAELLERLLQSDALGEGGNPAEQLADYCTVLEGVSHFLYLGWHATHGRDVTPLELEMQAEIDKYVLSARRMPHRQAPAQLHRWLFDRADFAADLERPELERYRDASRYASAYCRQLAQRYLGSPGGDAALLNELRRFYRLPLHHKIQRIGRRH